VPYPIDTIEEALEAAKKIVAETGTSKPISKDEISRILSKKVASLGLFYSTLVQYGIFSLVHGKGYLPSELYRKYVNPIHNDDEYKAKLLMFKSPPLYAKIIDNLNNHQLPSDEKRLANLLKQEPYNVNQNSAERAAKVLFENARDLRLLDINNTLRYNIAYNQQNAQPVEKEITKSEVEKKKASTDEDDSLFELPIPLPGKKRKAYLKYPIEDLSKRDIMVIRKAIDFIESSIDTFEPNRDMDDLM